MTPPNHPLRANLPCTWYSSVRLLSFLDTPRLGAAPHCFWVEPPGALVIHTQEPLLGVENVLVYTHRRQEDSFLKLVI